MLAQNFKTSAELGHTDEELAAHITILGMLDRGELIHAHQWANIDNGFNMRVLRNESDCGTVCCIQGWVNFLIPAGAKRTTHGGDSAHGRLIMPPGGADEWAKITTSQAANALRNYLTTGEARWDEALAG